MRKINIIGDQVFFDRIAVADLRTDALPSLKDDFSQQILRSNYSSSSDNTGETDTYSYDKGYDEGYSDAVANSCLEKR